MLSADELERTRFRPDTRLVGLDRGGHDVGSHGGGDGRGSELALRRAERRAASARCLKEWPQLKAPRITEILVITVTWDRSILSSVAARAASAAGRLREPGASVAPAVQTPLRSSA